jgi:hypothetical protein
MKTAMCAISGMKAKIASWKLNSDCDVLVVFPTSNSNVVVVEFLAR